MSGPVKTIVRQVLSEAVDAPHFFDQSDAQRLNWMIERAYELGKQKRGEKAKPATKRKRPVHRRSKPRRVAFSILVKSH